MYPYAVDPDTGYTYWLDIAPFLHVLRLAELWHCTPDEVERQLPIYRQLASIDSRIRNQLDMEEQIALQANDGDSPTNDPQANLALRKSSEAARMQALLNPPSP